MTCPSATQLLDNLLLSRLSEEDRARLVPHMLVFDLDIDFSLQRAGEEVVDTWFPCGAAMAAFCVAMPDSEGSVEVALVGREGAIGGIVSNGNVPSYTTARVLYPGRFLRIRIAALEQAKVDSIALRHWFSRYSDCLLAQVFQTAACNARHSVTQRAAKWLLAASSRTGTPDFSLTQKALAELLGVGRSFVARTVGRLRVAKILDTRRGVFIIKDEARLRQAACQCTLRIEDHFATVLDGIYPRG